MGAAAREANLHVSVNEALVMLAAGSVLLDVREFPEWRAGHDPIAVHMPIDQVPFESRRLDLAIPVLVICRSGNRSLLGATQLRQGGLRAFSVDGGMSAWQQAGRTVVRDSGDPGTIL